MCESCSARLSGGQNPDLWVTMELVEWMGHEQWALMLGATYPSYCGCGEGAWLGSDSECHICGEGLICSGMGTVTVEPGYFAPADNAADVWQCHGVWERCPGGSLGTCADGRKVTSIACGECEEGTREEADGPCVECTSIDALFVIMFLVLVLLSTFFLCRVVMWKDLSKQRASSIISSQLMTALQILGVFLFLRVEWPEPIETILSVAGLVNLNLKLLSVECLFPISAVGLYCAPYVVYASLLVVVLLIHLVVFHRRTPKESRRLLITATGTLGSALFTSISAIVLAPFQCESHPNGYSTLRTHPQVVCWSSDFGDDHMVMVVVGAVGATISTGFVALCIWVIVTLPERMRAGDTNFLHTFSFLLLAFKPGSFWYMAVPVFRNLTIVLVLLVGDASLQLFLISIILGPCIVLCATVSPYCLRVANLLDAATNVCLMNMLFLAAVTTYETNMNVADMMTVILSALALVFLCGAIYSIFQLKIRLREVFRFFVCHHKERSSGFAKVLQLCLQKDVKVRHVFLELDVQDTFSQFDRVGTQTDTLVVLCISEIFSRPRCVGEMTTALLHGVDTVLVMFPDFTWPCDEFFFNCGKHADGVMYLTKYGISEGMLQETLQWLKSRTMICLSKHLSFAGVEVVARKLITRRKGQTELATVTGLEVRRSETAASSSDLDAPQPPEIEAKHWEFAVQDAPDTEFPEGCIVAVVVDRRNHEALCAAFLMKELLVSELSGVVEMVPYVLGEEDTLPASIDTVVVVCSTGCFHHPPFVRHLFASVSVSARFVPVVVEEHFRFPSIVFFEELRELFPVNAMEGKNVQDLTDVVRKIFSRTAVSVFCHDDADVLAVNIAGIAGRLCERKADTEDDPAVEGEEGDPAVKGASSPVAVLGLQRVAPQSDGEISDSNEV